MDKLVLKSFLVPPVVLVVVFFTLLLDLSNEDVDGDAFLDLSACSADDLRTVLLEKDAERSVLLVEAAVAAPWIDFCKRAGDGGLSNDLLRLRIGF